MKQINDIIIVSAMAFGIAMLTFASPALAYCVHNQTDRAIHVKQTEGGTHTPFKRFSKKLKVGESACCDWRDADCAGDKDMYVTLNAHYFVPNTTGLHLPTIRFVCNEFSVLADGKMFIQGKDGGYTCEAEK